MAAALHSCSIGEVLNKTCHLTTYIKTVGTKIASEFSEDELYTLSLRAHVPLESIVEVCFHHEEFYLSENRVFGRNLYCCDPFSIHNKKVTGNIIFK